jgi:hypothetical protein
MHKGRGEDMLEEFANASHNAKAAMEKLLKGLEDEFTPVDSPDITIIFKNPAALRNFIFSPKPDILNAILRQEVSVDGNLNYLYKFAYMANHLKLMAQELMA